MEIWRKIEGFESYEVSNMGRVRSLDRVSCSGHKLTGKVLIPTQNQYGYLIVSLYKNGTRYIKRVHRLVSVAFIPNPEGKPQVNHIDGDKSNNRVSNLEWATAKENCQHAYNAGLHKPIKHTEESKKKMSESHGYCVTDEDRANNYKNWNNELRFFDGNEGCADFKKIEDLREEFEKEEIKQVDYEQLSFI